MASEIWERITQGGHSLSLSLQSVWARIEAGWLTALSGIQRTWADFLPVSYTHLTLPTILLV